ncbi:MAG: hypothetical protein HDKAJFGB_00975 [Anaerolineae bacterium]|nr:hypothetical protein [Anaerolineae bacterium]
MQTTQSNLARVRPFLDGIIAAALFLLTLFVYLKTLAPSVAYLFDDSLEFQLLASRLAIAHPTGYPFYSILLKLATFLPFGDVAYRANLVSALSGAGAIAFVYLAAHLLTLRFARAEQVAGEILTRLPALAAALTFAFGATFWSQSILAEVYALQAFLTAVMLWLVLRWGAMSAPRAPRALLFIAFWAGLMLTHHRMSVLLLPALAVYVLSYERSFLRQPRVLLQLALAFALPLLLYLYLPLRGMVTTSLDGAYQNTPAGFVNWILGTAYTVFITQNPLTQTRDANYYWALWRDTFTPLGLLVTIGGFVALFLRAWREWLLLMLGLAANLFFALTYRVADIDVFFIPAFLLGALGFAAGLAGLLWLAYYFLSPRAAMLAAVVGALVALWLPMTLFQDHYARVDLSAKTDVAAYGRAMLTQALPDNSTLIGILGEMTLARYFQETQGLRPDVETIAADKPEERRQAVDDALARGRTVFLTRPLEGIEKQNALTAVGPLIQVQPRANRQTPPTPARALNANFNGVNLLGYTRAPNAPTAQFIPITLYWQAPRKIENNLLVSLKLLDADGRIAGQIDRQPVADAYPTSAWRNKEYIADAYEVPIFVGAAPGEYTLQVTLYDPASGRVYGQQELERVAVPPTTENVAAELLGVREIVLRDLGGLEFAGYDLDTSEAFAPGARVPVTLLWRLPDAGATREIELAVTDQLGKNIVAQTLPVGESAAQAGQYARQEFTLALPENLAPGKYPIQVRVRGGANLPFQSSTMTLGMLEAIAQ